MPLTKILRPAPLQDFTYSPLDPSSPTFRVIRLLPPIPSRIPFITNGTIRIELLTVNADSAPSYDALSYVWNVPPSAPPPDRPIVVETKSGPRRLHIYRSLELALLHLCATGNTDRPLFVDQICINQRDTDEKSHQVQLMRIIYSKCIRTVIWLGPATRYSTPYLDFVEEISHEGILARVMGRQPEDFLRVFDAVMDPDFEVDDSEREDRDDLLAMVHRFGPIFPLDGLADVLDRSWFGRLWIIQEACLAPTVVFLCGLKLLCFDCFRSGVLFFKIYNTHWVRHIKGPISQHELRRRNAIFDKTDGLIRIFQERKAIHRLGVRQDLYDLVLKYNVNDDKKKIGAGLAVDRIFGLLGLVAENDVLAGRVRVLYDNVVQTYAEVMALLLEHSIDALVFSQFPKQTAGLPSWIPDWAMNLSVPVGYSNLNTPVFAAGGPGEGARFSVDIKALQLTVRGIFIDTISCVGDQTYEADPESQIMQLIDNCSAKRTFDEVSQFVQAALIDSPSYTPESAHATSLRVCDSGLSYRYFETALGPSAGPARLSNLHASTASLGERLIRSQQFAESYRISRIYSTVGITPWYVQLLPDMDMLRLCSKPLDSAKTLCLALLDALTDLCGLCLASAVVSLSGYYLRFRRRFFPLNLKPSREHLARVGVDPDVAFGQDMNAFGTAIAKNKGRKVYRTEGGVVGMGPGQTRVGDCVVVFKGGTTAHILRESGDSGYAYIGEAYCDGIMDGEALNLLGKERDFTLV